MLLHFNLGFTQHYKIDKWKFPIERKISEGLDPSLNVYQWVLVYLCLETRADSSETSQSQIIGKTLVCSLSHLRLELEHFWFCRQQWISRNSVRQRLQGPEFFLAKSHSVDLTHCKNSDWGKWELQVLSISDSQAFNLSGWIHRGTQN